MHATEVGNTVFFNPAPEAQFLAAVSMALAVIAAIMLPRIRDGVVAGIAVQALVAVIPVALREGGFQALTVDFGHTLSWVNIVGFYVQWLFVFLVTFGVRSLRHFVSAASDDDLRIGNDLPWLKRLLRLEGEYLLHERALSFPLRPELRSLTPDQFDRAVSKLSARLPFVVPMILMIDKAVLRTPAKGSVGWLLYHRWHFVATVEQEDAAVDGFFRLNGLDRFMGLFVANGWAVMLAFMMVIIGVQLIEGTWSGLVMLLIAPLLFLWLRLCFSMYVPQRVRGETSVRELLGDPRDIGDESRAALGE